MGKKKVNKNVTFKKVDQFEEESWKLISNSQLESFSNHTTVLYGDSLWIYGGKTKDCKLKPLT